MPTNNGGNTSPLNRVYTIKLETGHKLNYIASEPITKEEAAKRIKKKFGCGGWFITK